MHHRTVAVVSLSCLCASTGLAQSFNIDLSDLAGTPPSSYGGAAGQAGEWFNIPSFNSGGVFPLKDITGTARAATIVPSLPNGDAMFDHPGTLGGDGALLDDYLDLRSAPTQVDIVDLVPGLYDVYVYTWAPDNEFFGTFVSIQGLEQGLIGGAWPGGLVEGVTHSSERVALAPGDVLTLNLFGLTKGTLNGLQIVSVPGPGGGVLLGGAVLVGVRRRRVAGG